MIITAVLVGAAALINARSSGFGTKLWFESSYSLQFLQILNLLLILHVFCCLISSRRYSNSCGVSGHLL